MPDYQTHEQYIVSVRLNIVDSARRMLAEELSFLEGSLTLAALGHEADARQDDPDFMTFVAINSETDNLPIGAAVQQHWCQEALKRLQPEFESAEAWARSFGTQACESLIQRYGM